MSTSPIMPGDEVQLKRDHETKARRIYGDKAMMKFIVETRDRHRGRTAVTGGGLMYWLTDVKRTRTSLQIAREKAGQTA